MISIDIKFTMNNQKRIKETKIEDFIFIIYYIIITLSLYSNKIEREYLRYHDEAKRDEYRKLLYLIFGIATIVYLYYAFEGLKSLQESQNEEIKRLNQLALFASVLTVITGFIYLYIISQDKDINVELAFN